MKKSDPLYEAQGTTICLSQKHLVYSYEKDITWSCAPATSK